jgi:hypothetical protein
VQLRIALEDRTGEIATSFSVGGDAPEQIFQTIQYPAPSGSLGAYLSPDPGDGKKHPPFFGLLAATATPLATSAPAPRNNDQTAAAYRNSGIIMIFPSLRSGNDNLGTIEDISNYGEDSGFLPFDISNRWKIEVRSPTWVFEGTEGGNIDALRAMKAATTNPKIQFIEVQGLNHFSILAPVNEMIAILGSAIAEQERLQSLLLQIIDTKS